MLTSLSPEEVQRRLSAGEIRLIDIRETDEYAEVSIPGARLIPLSVIRKHPLTESGSRAKPVVFTCRSGNRTREMAPLLESLVSDPAYVLDGGVAGWEKAGLPVERTRMPLPLFRQIQIGAGSLVLIGTIGGAFWPPLYWLSAFVGAGLVFAGVTGFCGLGILLSRMPWNRPR